MMLLITSNNLKRGGVRIMVDEKDSFLSENSVGNLMSVQEVAKLLDVTPEAIKKHIRILFPELIQNGVQTFLSEFHVFQIKKQMRPTTKVVGAVTEMEMHEMTYNVLVWHKEKLDQMKKSIEEMKPKAEFSDIIIANSKTYSFREAAKLLGFKDIGERTLFQFCRDQHFLMLNNEPYQIYMAQGLFKQVTEKFEKASGEKGVYLKTVITGKGLNVLSKKLVEKGYSRVKEFVMEDAILV
jgi:phage antirepressor YoqD-like protein